MKVGTSYKHKKISGDYDAIVIGSGMGGLMRWPRSATTSVWPF
jgi:hypothetical protein